MTPCSLRGADSRRARSLANAGLEGSRRRRNVCELHLIPHSALTATAAIAALSLKRMTDQATWPSFRIRPGRETLASV